MQMKKTILSLRKFLWLMNWAKVVQAKTFWRSLLFEYILKFNFHPQVVYNQEIISVGFYEGVEGPHYFLFLFRLET